MYLYIKALVSRLIVAAMLQQLEPKGYARATGRGVVRFAVVGLLICLTAVTGTTTKTRADETIPTTISSITLPDIQDIFSEPQPKTVSFELVESEYDRKKKAEQQAAKARAIAIKPKPAVAMVNKFYAGQCTAYVATRFPVTWRGDAIEWSVNARAQGYLVDKVAEAGAILSTTDNSWGANGAGHVAYIEAVADGLIYLSEQNYVGKGIVSKRTIAINSPLILAVIHRR